MHIGIILDGNGRFATAQNQPRLFGHQAGVSTLKDIVTAAPQLGISTLTVYAFAIANWKRDQDEVNGLWELFRHMFRNELQELIEGGIRVRIIGNRAGLPADVADLCGEVEERSSSNTKALLQIALNYDGIDEVVRLIQRAIDEKVPAHAVTSAYVLEHLDTEANHEPDIVIRTGMPHREGKFSLWRSSAFLPLQSAQSVCVSTATLWPAFTAEELKDIIIYANPDSRLFGGQRNQ